MLRRALPFFGLLALAACSSTADDDAVGSDEAAQTGVEAWGPALSLRDDTAMFADRPQDGWFVTPIHATLLPSGKVLVSGWGRAQADRCQFPEGSRSHGMTFLVDPSAVAGATTPASLKITPIDEHGDSSANWTPDVLYCAGHVPTAGGVLYTGGARYQSLGVRGQEAEVGLTSARFYDYASGQMSKVGTTMKGGPAAEAIKSRPQFGPIDKRGWRWYPTNTRLPDGKVLVSGGFSSLESENDSVEIFDPANQTFSLLVQHDDAYPAIRGSMAPGLKDYTHTFLLPEPPNAGGRARQIAMLGWRGQVLLMSTDANVPNNERFAMTPGANRPGGAGWDSSAALLSTGEIMVLGGTNDPAVARRADLYDPRTDQWTQVDTGIGRRNPASVLLPDGNVMLIGGWDEDGNLPGDRRRPQILDPRTRKVTTLAPWTNDTAERGYHSFAMLLKDGSVLVGGGVSPKVNGVEITSIGCERNDLRVYRPAYLTAGARPVIDLPEPIALTIGKAAEVEIPFHGTSLPAKGAAVLMALPSTTHAFDQNQRHVALDYRLVNGKVVVKAPADPTKAPEGDYLLFLVSNSGVPSVAKHVHLERSTDPVPGTSQVTFRADNAVTTFGTNVFVVGDAPSLGAWNAANAVPLAPTAYPTWTGTVTLPRGANVSFKFIKKDGAGNVTWESGDDRHFTVPNAATGATGGPFR